MTKSSINRLDADGTNESSNRSNNIKKKNSQKTSYQCKICGAPAIYSNFGVISCFPCKMFFKRNAELGQTHFTCDFGGQCVVNINTRRLCSSCRLAKCFASGMQIKLIRCSHTKRKTKKQTAKKVIESIIPMNNNSVRRDQVQRLSELNLLELNKSILGIHEWNTISKLIDSYNEQSELLLVQQFISEQNNIPVKIRYKCGSVRQFILSLLSKTQLLFETNEKFLLLCSHDRSILLHRHMKYIAIIKFIVISQQTDLVEHLTFSRIINSFLRTMIRTIDKCSVILLDFDVVFLQLALLIISFSTFDYTIYENIPANNLINKNTITNAQNMYIELAWRYLLSEYNYQQTIICFSNLVRTIFAVNDIFILMKNEKCFTDIIDYALQRTDQTFDYHF